MCDKVEGRDVLLIHRTGLLESPPIVFTLIFTVRRKGPSSKFSIVTPRGTEKKETELLTVIKFMSEEVIGLRVSLPLFFIPTSTEY